MGKGLLVMCAVALAVSPVLADNLAPQRLSDVANAPVAPTAEEVNYSSGPIAAGELVWYDKKSKFDANAGEEICLEDFEESELPPGEVQAMNDPLKSRVRNDPLYPNGLEECRDMTVQSNILMGNPDRPVRRGTRGLAAVSEGFRGATSDVVVANFWVDSLDYLVDPDDVFAVGGKTLTFIPGVSVEIRVYDAADNLLGMQSFPADPAGTNFFGVVSLGTAIGRINVFDPVGGNAGAEGLDNVQLHKESGACCFPDESCEDDLTKVSCEDEKGLWHSGKKCKDFDCGENTCRYKDAKVKAQGDCKSCPDKRDCKIKTRADCGDVNDCKKKIKEKMKCPGEEGGKCKFISKRCDCK